MYELREEPASRPFDPAWPGVIVPARHIQETLAQHHLWDDATLRNELLEGSRLLVLDWHGAPVAGSREVHPVTKHIHVVRPDQVVPWGHHTLHRMLSLTGSLKYGPHMLADATRLPADVGRAMLADSLKVLRRCNQGPTAEDTPEMPGTAAGKSRWSVVRRQGSDRIMPAILAPCSVGNDSELLGPWDATAVLSTSLGWRSYLRRLTPCDCLRKKRVHKKSSDMRKEWLAAVAAAEAVFRQLSTQAQRSASESDAAAAAAAEATAQSSPTAAVDHPGGSVDVTELVQGSAQLPAGVLSPGCTLEWQPPASGAGVTRTRIRAVFAFGDTSGIHARPPPLDPSVIASAVAVRRADVDDAAAGLGEQRVVVCEAEDGSLVWSNTAVRRVEPNGQPEFHLAGEYDRVVGSLPGARSALSSAVSSTLLGLRGSAVVQLHGSQEGTGGKATLLPSDSAGEGAVAAAGQSLDSARSSAATSPTSATAVEGGNEVLKGAQATSVVGTGATPLHSARASTDSAKAMERDGRHSSALPSQDTLASSEEPGADVAPASAQELPRQDRCAEVNAHRGGSSRGPSGQLGGQKRPLGRDNSTGSLEQVKRPALQSQSLPFPQARRVQGHAGVRGSTFSRAVPQPGGGSSKG